MVVVPYVHASAVEMLLNIYFGFDSLWIDFGPDCDVIP